MVCCKRYGDAIFIVYCWMTILHWKEQFLFNAGSSVGLTAVGARSCATVWSIFYWNASGPRPNSVHQCKSWRGWHDWRRPGGWNEWKTQGSEQPDKAPSSKQKSRGLSGAFVTNTLFEEEQRWRWRQRDLLLDTMQWNVQCIEAGVEWRTAPT